MKKHIYLFIMLQGIVNTRAFACDFCSCFMGITPYDNQSGISLLHRYRSYNGYVKYNQSSVLFPQPVLRPQQYGMLNAPAHINPNQDNKTSSYSAKDYEVYKVTELRLKYFIHQRIEINAVLPYSSNSTLTNEVKTKTAGFADITFFAGYHILKKIDESSVQQRLIVGAGLKLPTGNSNKQNANGIRLNYELQTGTGSSDYFGYIQYVIGYKKLGLSSNALYKVSCANKFNEQLSPGFNGSINLFYKLIIRKLIMIPSWQGYYEFNKGLKVNTQIENGTQLNALMTGPGLDMFYKNFSVNLSLQLPVHEQIAENGLGNGCKLSLALTYNFNQRKYLFSYKSKS